MRTDLEALAGRRHADAFVAREDLARLLAAGADPAIFEATVCLTLLAGAGSRWVKGLDAAKRALRATGQNAGNDGEFAEIVGSFPLDAPRGLFPVKNYITGSFGRIPLAAYAVDAFKGLGRHVIVIRGWQDEIRTGIIDRLGIGDEMVQYCSQKEGPAGKVLGHGDATRQAMPAWKDSRYVIANFGGDANSPLTAMSSLLALAELEKSGASVNLLLPVAAIPDPAYPVILDEEGRPRSFGHDKLHGRTRAATGTLGYTNVGIRVYRTAALRAATEELVQSWWDPSLGYSIPGNDPEAHEFALDNIDALFASRGEARILPIARPGELTPAKNFEDLPKFEEAARMVRAEWNAWKAGT
jgi:hypothetical protein